MGDDGPVIAERSRRFLRRLRDRGPALEPGMEMIPLLNFK